MLNGGFVLGLRYGRGVATCRTGKGWSTPAFFVVEGGSFGLQFGGQAVDVIMLIMNDNGMTELLSSVQAGRRGERSRWPHRTSGRSRNRLEDARSGVELLPFSRRICGGDTGTRNYQTGQGQHTSVLRTHGPLQGLT